MNIMRAAHDQLFEYGPFSIRRQRPGEAFGPLAIVDQMTLKTDARIPMHRHQDDEIFTYVWRGSAQHLAENGEKTALNTRRVMVVNAGSGVRHEESAPFIETHMLQAYIRPAQSGGEPRAESYVRDDTMPPNQWTLLAGPTGSGAPLELRQDVLIYDLKLARGQQLAVPHRPGYASWLTVLEGNVRIGNERVQQGDAVSAAEDLPALTSDWEATLVMFLVRADAPAVMSGTLSGS